MNEWRAETDKLTTNLKHEKQYTVINQRLKDHFWREADKRKDEVKKLEEVIQNLRAEDEIKDAMGGLQVRVLQLEWQKKSLESRHKALRQDCNELRKEVLDGEVRRDELIEKHAAELQQKEESLKTLRSEASQWKLQATSSLPFEKAEELTNRVSDMHKERAELFDANAALKQEKHELQCLVDEKGLAAELHQFNLKQWKDTEEERKDTLTGLLHDPEMPEKVKERLREMRMTEVPKEKFSQILEKLKVSRMEQLKKEQIARLAEKETDNLTRINSDNEEQIQNLTQLLVSLLSQALNEVHPQLL